MPDFATIDRYLVDADVDGWLIYDFRGSNPILSHLLEKRYFLTRRAFLLLSRSAQPRLFVSRVDATAELLDQPGVHVETYTSWKELRDWLDEYVAPLSTVAMEYSPHGELPAMSWVDGGTLDLVRERGTTIVSSADLFQQFAAQWSTVHLESHRAAMVHLVEIKDLAFALVEKRLKSGRSCSEYDVQKLILDEFARRELVTDDPPVVGVNAHSGDPHYEPSEDSHAQIRPGDWLLVDLWCKERGEHAVFADITWVAYVGPRVPDEHQKVFDLVARARDAVVDELRKRSGEPIPGYELDRVARSVITDAGYGEYFVHRTGHSLGPGEAVHGLGGNLDDLETHDTRPIGPGLGFTIEPGIYLAAFGVRSEINVYMTDDGPEITSPVQTAPIVMELN